MPDIQFQPTVIDTIIDILKAGDTSNYFKAFYYGDPIDFPTSVMPCIAVELKSTKITGGPTGMDRVNQTVIIKVIYNKYDDFNLANDTEVTGQRKLEEMAQGLDPVSSFYDNTSIVGLVRSNLTLNSYAVGQDIDINYGVVPRPNETLTAEAQITMTIESLQLVPVRT
jgi:hypothetical protein